MAYGTPADPVAGTVITVAYAVANLLNPIRALRSFTGGADPPGTGYVVTSDSTSATTWKTFLAAMDSALGARAAKVTGDTFTGDVRVQRTAAPTTGFILWGNAGNYIGFDGTNVVITGNTAWHAGNDGAGSGLDADLLDGQQGAAYGRLDGTGTWSGVIQFAAAVGNKIGLFTTAAGIAVRASQAILYRNSGVEWGVADDDAGTNFRTIWHAGNDGAGSGLDADLLDGSQGTAYLARANHTGQQTASTISDFDAAGDARWAPIAVNAKIASGSYTGNGTAQAITVGFQPKVVYIRNGSGGTGLMVIAMPSGEAMGFQNGNVTFALSAGQVTFSATQFSVSTAATPNINGQTYNYVAIG